jgi:hypothetical protein
MKSARRFQRVKISAMDVIKPMVALLMLNIIILTVWTIEDPLGLETIVVTKDPFDRNTETYGTCSSDHDGIYLGMLLTINLGCLLFAVFQAYQARSISTELQESGYIFTAMAFILVVAFIGIPVLIVARGNVAAIYFISTGIIFIVCTSILTLIFIPKVLALRKPTPRRGSTSAPSSQSTNSDDEGIKIVTSPLVMAQMEREIQDLKKLILAQGVENERLFVEDDDEVPANTVDSHFDDAAPLYSPSAQEIQDLKKSMMGGDNNVGGKDDAFDDVDDEAAADDSLAPDRKVVRSVSFVTN